MLQALYARRLAGEGAQRLLSPRTVRYTYAILRIALKEAGQQKRSVAYRPLLCVPTVGFEPTWA